MVHKFSVLHAKLLCKNVISWLPLAVRIPVHQKARKILYGEFFSANLFCHVIEAIESCEFALSEHLVV